jgi:hypothetical protein
MEPTQVYRYARLDDGEVFLANAQKAFFEMDRSLSLLRNPYVFYVDAEPVRRIEFARFWKDENEEDGDNEEDSAGRRAGEESVVVAVERDGQGKPWRLVSPVEAPASQERVGALLKEIQFATGRGHIDDPEDLADYGLDPPNARLTLFTAPGSDPQTLYLGSVNRAGAGEGGLFVKRASLPGVFLMDDHVMSLLPKSPSAFREGHLMTGAATDLHQIRYRAGDSTDLLLENDPDKGWRLVRPAVDDTDQVAVSNFIAYLKAAEGHGFPGEPQPAWGLDEPVITVELVYQGETEPGTIKVGRPAPDVDLYYGTLENGTVVLLSQLDVQALTKDEYYFREKRLMAFATQQPKRLEMTVDGTRYVFDKPRGHWRVKEPQDMALESPSDVAPVIGRLYNLRAITIETETPGEDLAPYGLDAPIAVISVVLPGSDDREAETTLGPLRVGSPAPDNTQERFAMIAGKPAVYRIGQALMDDVRETLKRIH